MSTVRLASQLSQISINEKENEQVGRAEKFVYKTIYIIYIIDYIYIYKYNFFQELRFGLMRN